MTSAADRQRRHRQRMYANGWHYVNGYLTKTPRKQPRTTQGAAMTDDDPDLEGGEPCADCGGTGTDPTDHDLCQWCQGTGIVNP